MKTPTADIQLSNLSKDIVSEISQWNYIYTNGGSDPFYEDGGNLNLTRNHIISDKNQIRELCKKYKLPLPPEYELPTPLELDNAYMARADEIRENASQKLLTYQSNQNYKALIVLQNALTTEQLHDTSILRVINYASSLEKAIEQDDLVTMRRHEHADYIKSFKECLESVQQIRSVSQSPGTQVSLFDYIYPNDCINDEEDIQEEQNMEL